MARLIEDTLGAGLETIRLLVTNSLFTSALAAEIRKEGGVTRALDALHREFFPEEKAEPAPEPVPLRFRKIDENTIEVYNDVPSNLPFNTAERTWNVTKAGTVILTKTGEGKALELFRDGLPIILHVDPAQKASNGIKGEKLWEEKLKGLSGHLSGNELDALVANPEFIPDSWKAVGAVFFWSEGFRFPAHGSEYVRYLFWNGQRWYVHYYWLGVQWHEHSPAAVAEEKKAA